MKKLLLALLMVSSVAKATDAPKELYVQYEPTVQIVISNAPCTKWGAKDVNAYQLNYAYAINTETGAKIDGCFTHAGEAILINLSDDEGNGYSYKINADNFQPRPTL